MSEIKKQMLIEISEVLSNESKMARLKTLPDEPIEVPAVKAIRIRMTYSKEFLRKWTAPEMQPIVIEVPVANPLEEEEGSEKTVIVETPDRVSEETHIPTPIQDIELRVTKEIPIIVELPHLNAAYEVLSVVFESKVLKSTTPKENELTN